MKTKNTYRILAAVLALLVLLGQLPAPARAAETTGLCEHHTAHEDCGYVEGDPGQPCTFRCDQCAQEPTTGAPDGAPPACVCTGKCAAESVNPDCPVCYADVTQCTGQEPTPTATGIQVTTLPAKTQYQLQEPLDLTGGVLTVTYSDGSTQDMAITQDMVSGFKNDTACTLTLTVTWGGFEAYFDVTVLQPQTDGGEGNQETPTDESVTTFSADPASEREIAGVTLITKPTKLQYLVNEETPDTTGGQLSVYYTDGTAERVDVTPDMVTNFDTSTTGYHSLCIAYEGYQNCYTVAVVESADMPLLMNSQWKSWPKSVYFVGEELDMSGAVYVLYYSDGSQVEISVTNDMVWGFDSSYAHEYDLTVQINHEDFNGALSHRVHIVEQSMLHGDCGSHATWELEDGTLRITGVGEVTACPWSDYKSLITAVEIGEGITYVHVSGAFGGCANLTSVSLPTTLRHIPSEAFCNCPELKSITIPENVTYIEEGAFEGTGLKEIIIPSNVDYLGHYAFAYCTDLKKIVFEGIDPPYRASWAKNTVFDGVIATAYYPVMGLWEPSDFESYGGNIQWIATGEMNAPEISCPYSETIQIDVPQENVRFYTFRPQESGAYILSWETEAGLNFEPTVSYTDADGNTGKLEPNVLYDGRRGYTLESGICYTLRFKFYLYDDGAASGTFRLEKEAGMTGIKIRGGDRTVLGADGERLYGGSMYVDFYPENAIGEVTWESSAPEVAEVLSESDDGRGELYSYGQGTAVITARCGEFSDSVTITVQKPEELVLGQTIQVMSDGMGPYYYAFTPPETGRYAIAYECEVLSAVQGSYGGFAGRYMPEDCTYSSNNSGDVIHGIFTAGVTYYYQVRGPVRWTITMKKEEEKPVAMNVHCSSYYSNEMYFTVEFVPSNSYDEIVSWKSSDPEILDIKYGYSTDCNAYIYGTGEVTVTAISAGGLRASCTVTVGQCDSGHTYGPWRQTREPGCAIDGLETATCICGLRQYRSIPATGHTYDNNCDPDCNTCGETRTVEHSFSQSWAYSETAHWHVCTVCGERSQLENHVPGPAATQDSPQTCTLCGCVLKSALGHSHSYGDAWVCGDTGHWHACDGCSARKDYSGHVYTDACDPTCNICGYVRENIHISGGVLFSDRGGHWYTCTLCGTKLDHHAHEPGAAATATTPQLCAVCGYVLQKATGQTTTIIQQTVTNSTGHTHRYDTRLTMDEDGHWYACSGCATRKDYERHRYTDDCDPGCAVCGYTRTVSHNAGAEWAGDGAGHWYPCLDCGEKLSFAEHRMENGVCTVCGYAQQEEQPPAAQPPTEPTAPAAPDTGAGGDGTAADQSQGLPRWMLLVAGLVSSAATLTIAGAVLWANRKKIAALFTGK